MTEPSASRGTAPAQADRLAPSQEPIPAPGPAPTSPPVSCRSCCCFWTAAKCLAAATEPKRAAKGLLEMLLLFSWSVISPQGRAIRVNLGKAAGRVAVRARGKARSPGRGKLVPLGTGAPVPTRSRSPSAPTAPTSAAAGELCASQRRTAI